MTPKQRLLANKPLAEAAGQILHSSLFQEACDVAMLEFVLSPSFTLEAQSAIASHYRLEGARLFMGTLRTIADQPKTNQSAPVGQLDHEMKFPSQLKP